MVVFFFLFLYSVLFAIVVFNIHTFQYTFTAVLLMTFFSMALRTLIESATLQVCLNAFGTKYPEFIMLYHHNSYGTFQKYSFLYIFEHANLNMVKDYTIGHS